MNNRICSIKNKGLAGVLSIVICLVLVLAVFGTQVPGDVQADDGGRTYSVMHPDRETREEWIESYNSAPRARIEMREFQVPGPGGSLSLLDHLEYTPAERSQGSCGNCWAWAGTGCLEIALDVHEEIHERLSVQYLNSCKSGSYACCGGWLSSFTGFYDPDSSGTGLCIPWSNENGSWQDYSRTCYAGSSTVSCGSISTDPNYPIISIQDVRVETQTVGQETAIANIKNVLDQDKAIWFAFYLPTNAAWNDFFGFWNTNSEDDVYQMDKYCGTSYADGGGHAVLCVGYNDTSPGNEYWIMLNSWGTPAGRPDGLFRIDMDMDYGCSYTGLVDAFYWQTLNVTFGIDVPDITVSPESFDVTLPSNTTQDSTLTIGNEGTADLDYTIIDEDTTEAGGTNCTWLDEAPDSGTVVAGGPAGNVTVTFNSTGLTAGDYSADIVISSNDPDENPEIVPVALHVVMPDLVVTDKYEEWVSFEAKSYNITYTVKNQGGLAATASKTGICVDAGSWGFYDCPSLEPGASASNTVGPFYLSDDSDSIRVCADEQHEIDESDEDNNCRQNAWGTVITGVTMEVTCETLGEVTVRLYNNGDMEGTTSDGDGNYSFIAYISAQGNYELVASKSGYRDERQAINMAESEQEYEFDFCGNTGLIPNAPGTSYLVTCIHYWLHPELGCELGTPKLVSFIHAWLHPIT